ncbi:MAG: RelA/SpoT family protein [Clostridia bacterium]|nr:RelA/SpoT family protein [Clostridia bacterium]
MNNVLEILKILEINVENKTKIELIKLLIEKATAIQSEMMLDILKMTADFKIGEPSMLATCLYIMIPKQEVNYDKISIDYCKTTADILKGLNTVGFLNNGSITNEAENIRNMLIAMTKDLRVLVILLCYVLFNLEHINELEMENKDIFVHSVRDIYAPLSARLGLSKIKNKLEDFSFRYLDPEIYESLSKEELLNKKSRQEQIALAMKKIRHSLKELNFKFTVMGREKHLASVYKKVKSKNLTINQLYDLMAIRVIVQTVDECYIVLGKINSEFTILPNRFKDYIAMPKPNGYQSLHTVILAENDRPIEVQIRTEQMHKFCEYGVAAHWIYKEKRKSTSFDEKVNWLRQLIEENKQLPSAEFIENIKSDMFNDEIFAQTPNGKVLKFPLGANCIDFAYAVHTDIGHKCVGAKINDKMVPISTKLNNGDICEIITNKASKGPSRDWLKLVGTSSARNKINQFFKHQFIDENIKKGKIILEKAIKERGKSLSEIVLGDEFKKMISRYSFNTIDEVYAGVGSGSISAEQVLNKIIIPEKKTRTYSAAGSTKPKGILVNYQGDMLTRFAKCCSPIPGDKIVGYVSRGRGVTVHRADCVNVKYLDNVRIVDVDWDKESTGKYVAKLNAIFNSDSKALNNTTQMLEKEKVSIVSLSSKINPNQTTEITIRVNVQSNAELDSLINKIEKLPNLKKVIRAN